MRNKQDAQPVLGAFIGMRQEIQSHQFLAARHALIRNAFER